MSIVLNGDTGITTPGLTNTGTETIVNLTTTGNTILGDASTDTLNVGNGGLVKDASGRVGIGTASPQNLLNVVKDSANASAAANAGLAIQSDSGATYTAGLHFGTDKTGVLSYIQSDSSASYSTVPLVLNPLGGNVGIGTSSPGSNRLNVQGDGTNTVATFYSPSTTVGAKIVLSDNLYNAYLTSLPSGGASGLGFGTSGAERARIDSSGNLTQTGVTTASGVLMSALGSSSSNSTTNSATYNVTINGSAKVFWVNTGNGDACLVVTNYTTATITILGTGGVIVASASPASNQLGISKSANSHVVTFKTGSAASSTYGSWAVGSLSSSVS